MRAIAVCIILMSLLLLAGCDVFLGPSEEEVKFQKLADVFCRLGATACDAEHPFYYENRVCVNAAELKTLYEMDSKNEETYYDKLSAIRAGEQSLVCGVLYPDKPYAMKDGSCVDKAQLDEYLKGFADIGFDDVPGPIENGGVGDCTAEARSGNKTAPAAMPPVPETPPAEEDEETEPCTAEGQCFPACAADGVTLTRYTCRRNACVTKESVDCMKEYGVSCIQTYVTLHGKYLTDPSGNFLMTGYCYGRPEKI